ncbi:protein FAR1-RELATED SEQUENCE 5-like [Rosa rugosa]|uniref:protein FAR1-RELATED SEQUENCE 5-like n=1 Tax=Rosa rugosa TaxID=74645 RepID=UPI002B40AE5E|nr:protein FAR1-RELATED SEQUENCE 5-like [Rosa rugosa]
MDNSLGATNIDIENSDLELDWKPRKGMEFDSEQAAYDFYNRYGGKKGFSIRRETHGKNKRTKELTSRLFVCCKEGIRSKDKRDYMIRKPRAETRTGCGAQLCIKLNRRNNKFFVSHFVEEHNHPLVGKECSHMLPSQRKVQDSQGIDIDLAHDSGIGVTSLYELMGKQAGGRDVVGYTKQDVKNYLRSRRQRSLEYGEAGYIMKYFSDQTLENPSFYHAMQLDSEEQITNLFWADAKMIIDYGQFGDVVSFDTTYKVNKSNRPLAVFVGFNHHRETIIFGVALMYDETADSFIWLFETFLRAMSGKAPKTIFTYQDAAMAKALRHDMPDSYHRLCKWHMMQNAIKHGHSFLTEEGGITSVLSRFMENVEEEDELISAWDAMLDKYGARDNTWLSSIYDLREKWGFLYVKRAWSAGIRSTQLSESFNSALKKYLDSDHNLSEFFIHFERMVADKRYKELEAEYDMCFRLPILKMHVKMLYEARRVYIKLIFEDFQDQFESSLEASITNCVDIDGGKIYTVIRDGYSRERQVKRDSDDIVSCSCRLFEMKGVVCRHIIKVLREVMQIKEIPEHYILKRWTKKARAESVQDMHGREIQPDPKLQQASWYRSLCSTYIRISNRASENEKAYKLAMIHAEKLAKEIEDLLWSEMNANGDENEHTTQSTPIEQLNGNVVNAKGLKKKESSRGRKRRIKSQLEISMEKNKRQKQSSKKAIEVTPDAMNNVYKVTIDPLCDEENIAADLTCNADQFLEQDISASSLRFLACSQVLHHSVLFL